MTKLKIYVTSTQLRALNPKESRILRLPYTFHFYKRLFSYIPDILANDSFSISEVVLN